MKDYDIEIEARRRAFLKEIYQQQENKEEENEEQESAKKN